MSPKAPCALLALALLAGTSAFARPPGPPGGPHGPPLPEIVEHHADDLGISEEVVVAVQQVGDAARPDMEALRDELGDARGEMHDLMESDAPDRAAVLDNVRRIGDLETSLHELEVGVLLAIRALLTPDQWSAIREKLPHRRPHRGPPPGGRDFNGESPNHNRGL